LLFIIITFFTAEKKYFFIINSAIGLFLGFDLERDAEQLLLVDNLMVVK